MPRPTLWSGQIRLMHSPPRDAVSNMALDEAMLITAAEQETTLVRLYSWDRPSVSFGRNQRCAGIYGPERCEALSVPAVRRLTGGRALLHGRELTYAVAAPNAVAPTLRGGYEAINEILLDALQSLGVPAALSAPAARTPSPDLAPCFESPSAGELVVGRRKLVGSAQHRDATAFIQHGSILLDDDQGVLQALSLAPLPTVPPPATLREYLGSGLDSGTVATAISESLRRAATGDIVSQSDTMLPRHHVEAAASRYRDPRWTWRR
ncbi:MAG: hypothetical protein U5K74_05815 [Gemmatimonadaceae bacterium]|nr:hypothetical protein [Gemmatimonadaceae bacterium]